MVRLLIPDHCPARSALKEGGQAPPLRRGASPLFQDSATLWDSHSDLAPVFVKLRDEADAWQAARAAFMTRRLRQGRHPDTDPRFWDGYTEVSTPSLPNSLNGAALPRDMRWLWIKLAAALIVGLTLLIGVPILVWRACRWAIRSRSARREPIAPAELR